MKHWCKIHGWDERPYLVQRSRNGEVVGRSFVCRRCAAEAKARYARTAKARATRKAWEARNPEKVRAKRARYYDRHQERLIANWHVYEARRQAKDPTRRATQLQKIIDYSARVAMTIEVG